MSDTPQPKNGTKSTGRVIGMVAGALTICVTLVGVGMYIAGLAEEDEVHDLAGEVRDLRGDVHYLMRELDVEPREHTR